VVAKNRGFRVYDVPADGNCALHVICDQLSLIGLHSDVSSLRKITVDCLKSHVEMIDEGFLIRRLYRNGDAYLQKQAKDGHWCDEIMLRAIATHYNVEIVIMHECM